MNALELVRSLEGGGVYLSVESERLRLNAPKGVLTREIEALVTARRREIIEFLKGGQIPRVPRDRPIPASPGQAGLWFLDQVTPGDASYNITHTIRERGLLDLEAQERALNTMVSRHEVFRTTFREIDGQVCQIAAPELVLSIPVQDLRALPGEEREAAAGTATGEEARRPFDLARGPLLRYRILRLADDEWQSVLVIHHIIFDGWSLALFNREMAAL